MKTRTLWCFMGFPVFHTFGKKSSEIGGKVVAAAARDPKSAVRAHLAAQKLSLVSYFCPQTCSAPEETYIFPWARPWLGPPLAGQK